MKTLYPISFGTEVCAIFSIFNCFCNFLILSKQLQVNFCENGTGGDLDENGTFMEKTANCEDSERKDEKEEKEANEEEKLHLKEEKEENFENSDIVRDDSDSEEKTEKCSLIKRSQSNSQEEGPERLV